MSQNLSVKVPDELAARLRAAARGNVSQWVIEAIEDRLEREMWEQSKQVDALLGVDDTWLAAEQAAAERVQRAAR
jgi:predicted transcriptional regulator